jgi:membrane associated rhomboid family serine protease
LVVPLTQFAPWLAIVLLATWGGYPGAVCVTPLAWLIALRVGLVSVERSRSASRSQRLTEAALGGALFGLLQGVLFWVVLPRMGPILPSEQAQASGLVLAIVLGGLVFGAVLALFTGYLREQRRAREDEKNIGGYAP